MDILVTGHIARCHCAVANGLDRRNVIGFRDWSTILPHRKGFEDNAHLAELMDKAICIQLCKLPNRVNTDAVQLAAGRGTDIEQIVYRKRIHDFFVVVRFDPRNGVRLFVIAAELGCDLVVRNADAGCDTEFKLDPFTDLLRNRHR